MTDLIRAPFTPAQVEALNRYQSHGNMHPFTCGNNIGGANVVLIARADGWHCSEPLCDYRQDWAHAFMADPDAWPKPPFGATARADVRLVNTRTGQGVATGGNSPDVTGQSWPRTAPAGTDECDQSTSDAAARLRLAHQARRAKEHQLDDIRRALCDVGAIRDSDPYSHADLADVIRQTWGGGSADARDQLAAVLPRERRAASYDKAALDEVRDALAHAGHGRCETEDWPDVLPALRDLIAERDRLAAMLAQVREYAELAANSCRVNVGQTGEDILRLLGTPPAAAEGSTR